MTLVVTMAMKQMLRQILVRYRFFNVTNNYVKVVTMKHNPRINERIVNLPQVNPVIYQKVKSFKFQQKKYSF
jgi:hypothetical protein